MTFRFEKGTGKDYDLWNDGNAQLLGDLREIGAGNVSENEIAVYIKALCEQLTERNTGGTDAGEEGAEAERGLFLQFADPESLTPDDMVDYVYRPTYIAAAILMTAYYRFSAFRTPEYAGILRRVLSAAVEREFTGAGYLRIPGLLDSLEINPYYEVLAGEPAGLETAVAAGTVIVLSTAAGFISIIRKEFP